MKTVSLDLLKAEIARPALGAYLEPLQRFRGSLSINRARAMWSFTNAMMLAECESLNEGTKLFQVGDLAHLCGFHAKAISSQSIDTFFNRLRLTPKVTAMVPGLQDYVSALNRWPFHLEECGAEAFRLGRDATLKKLNGKVVAKLKADIRDPSQSFYPFVVREPKKEHELLLAVHAAVPKGINYKIRGDLCQDLLVAVIAGELTIENIPNELPKYLKEARKLIPHEIGDLAKMGGNLFRHGISVGDSNHNWNKGETSTYQTNYRHKWQDLYSPANFRDGMTFNERVEELKDDLGCGHDH